MEIFTQVEPEYQYEIPSPVDSYDPDADAVAVGVIATLVLSMVIGMILWGVILWRLPSRAGYKGAAQWIWFLLMYFPLTSALALLAFVFAPWPVKRQLEKSQSQVDELRRFLGQSKNKTLGIDDELEQLRQQMKHL